MNMSDSQFAISGGRGLNASRQGWAGRAAGMARRLGLAAMVGAALVLAGCGDSGPDLKSEFAARLSEDWQVESFKVEAKEDVGSKVEPQFSYRYRAEVSPRADLYQRVGALEGTDILERVMKKGEEAPALGTARALFRADKWETVFSPEQGAAAVRAAL